VADRRRWLMLGLGMTAQASSCVYLYGLPYLLPRIRTDLDLTLSQASILIAFPTIGLLLALVAWGAAADHYGERVVMSAGLLLAAGFLIGAAQLASVDSSRPALAALLLLAGVGGASVNAASGRLVLGWFGPRDRGLAMGARQTAQPLGTALAAAALPAIGNAGGLRDALLACAALCAFTGLGVGLLAADPPRLAASKDKQVDGSPYRTPFLWRVHLASACMVVPQFAVTAFAFEFLTTERHWHSSQAGAVLAAGNLSGAAVRLAVGAWSDRAGSRLRPMRILAVATAAVVALVSVGAGTGTALGPIALVIGAAVTVATNGLAFTAVAERAGPRWAGRALGVQNTGQNIAAAVTTPGLGTLIEHSGYALAFAVSAGFSLAGAASTPVADEAPPPT
jgi:MFS family permease